MTSFPLSDLASSLRQQSQLRNLRDALDVAGRELTTGRIASPGTLPEAALRETFGIDRQLLRLEQTTSDLTRAQNRTAVTQNALGTIDSVLGTMATELLAAIERGDDGSAETLRQTASGRLQSVLSALNTQYAGESLFAGAATDRIALGSADRLISDIRALVAGAADAASARAGIDAYFGSGGDFETSFYGGSTTDAAPVALPDGSRIGTGARADDDGLRQVLKGLATLAAAEPGAWSAPAAERADLLRSAAQETRQSTQGLTALRARLGQDEEAIRLGIDATAAERAALQLARNELTAVDPFVAATRFNDLQGQLETLYTVTARLSGLSLTNFLR